jgi:hypothetical protein
MTIEIPDNSTDLQAAELIALAILRMDRAGHGYSRKAALGREVGRLVETLERLPAKRLAALYEGL